MTNSRKMFVSNYHQSSRAVTTVVQPQPLTAPLSKGYPGAVSSCYRYSRQQGGAQHRSIGIKHPNGIYKSHWNHRGNTQRWSASQYHKKPFRSINRTVVNTVKTHFLSQANTNDAATTNVGKTAFETFKQTWEEPIDDKRTANVELKMIQQMNYEKLKKQLDDLEKVIDSVGDPLTHNFEKLKGYKTADKESFEDNNFINKMKRKLDYDEIKEKKMKWDQDFIVNGWDAVNKDQWMAGCEQSTEKLFESNSLVQIKKTSFSPVESLTFDDVPKRSGWKDYKQEQLKKHQTDSDKNKLPSKTELKSKPKVTSPAAKKGVDMTIHKVDLLDRESLKVRQAGLVAALYSGMQCSGCDARFPSKDTLRYSQHLDWHFRQNRRDKEATRKPQHRPWFYSRHDWMDSAELQDKEETEPRNFFEQSASVAHEPAQQSSAPAPPGRSCCSLCGDQFQVFFHHELDEWHCRNAVLHLGNIYHPDCLKHCLDKVKKS